MLCAASRGRGFQGLARCSARCVRFSTLLGRGGPLLVGLDARRWAVNDIACPRLASVAQQRRRRAPVRRHLRVVCHALPLNRRDTAIFGVWHCGLPPVSSPALHLVAALARLCRLPFCATGAYEHCFSGSRMAEVAESPLGSRSSPSLCCSVAWLLLLAESGDGAGRPSGVGSMDKSNIVWPAGRGRRQTFGVFDLPARPRSGHRTYFRPAYFCASLHLEVLPPTWVMILLGYIRCSAAFGAGSATSQSAGVRCG